jgi:hypothetical protein
MRRLCHIALGHKIRTGPGRKTYPSETLQMQALHTLAGKIAPNLQSQTLSGPGDKPLFPENVTELELSSWIAGKLSLAADGKKDATELGGGTAGAVEAPVETPEHVSGEQSQGDRAARAAERVALSKPIAPPPPADPQARLNNYINQQVEAQQQRPRVVLRRGYRR